MKNTLRIRGQQRGPINFARKSVLRGPCGPKTSLYIPGKHAPGTTIRFKGSGDTYLVGRAGNLVSPH